MFKPLPLKCIEAFLNFMGFVLDRTAASHYVYKKRGNFRSVPLWGSKKEVPAFHIRTCSKVTGYTMKQIYDWAAINC